MSFNFKNCGFYSGPAPLLAYPCSDPPSKSFHPLISSFAQVALDGSLGILLCGGLTLVIELLALAQTDLELRSAVFEVHAQGNYRKTLLLDLGIQAADLFFVEKQPLGSQRVAGEYIAVLLRTDVDAVRQHLAVLDEAP